MPNRIGVAFVGCTHPHIFPRRELLLAESDVDLIGCYDPDAQLMAALERDYGLKAYDSPEELLDQPGVNFAIIEGWEPDNPRYVKLAAERGQAILLEKPGAANLAAMQEIVDTVKGANVPFQVGYMLRFNSGVEHARRILADGVLGPVTLARFHAAAPVGGAAEAWQSVEGDEGGLVYTDGCHMIDLMIYLLGMPKRMQGMALKLPAGEMVTAHGFKKDTLSGLGETVQMPLGGLVHEDAGTAMFDYGDKLAAFDITGWEAHPWVEAWRMEFYGTDGTLHVGIQPPWYRLYVRNPKPGYTPGWHTWDGFGVTGVGTSLVVDENYTGEIQNMLKRVREWDTDNAPWFAEAEGVITVLDAFFKSHRQGKLIDVKMRD